MRWFIHCHILGVFTATAVILPGPLTVHLSTQPQDIELRYVFFCAAFCKPQHHKERLVDIWWRFGGQACQPTSRSCIRANLHPSLPSSTLRVLLRCLPWCYVLHSLGSGVCLDTMRKTLLIGGGDDDIWPTGWKTYSHWVPETNCFRCKCWPLFCICLIF